MPSRNKLRIAGSFATLLIFALGLGCKGFFQNPILTTITVDPPTPSITQGATQQMTASATYQDGSTSTLTGGTSCSGNTVCWSSSDTTVATISTGGEVTGVGTGTSTITAASGAITGSTQATVILSNVTNFQVCEGTFGATTACSSGSTPLKWNVPSYWPAQRHLLPREPQADRRLILRPPRPGRCHRPLPELHAQTAARLLRHARTTAPQRQAPRLPLS